MRSLPFTMQGTEHSNTRHEMLMSDVKDQVSARKTLKLTAPPRRAVPAPKPAPKTTPGDWAAEHKRRMQADMDALSGNPKK